MFFCCIQKLNGGNGLKPELMDRIIRHFSYNWEKDKNYAFDQQGLQMMQQLPEKTVNSIFNSFLHQKFIRKYQAVFLIPKDYSLLDSFKRERKTVPRYYNWEDQSYRDFMLSLLRNLETRRVEAKTIILDEFEESQEVNFLQKGSIVVGYEINKIKKYCLMMKHRCVIGAYGVTFSVRSEFIYSSL